MGVKHLKVRCTLENNTTAYLTVIAQTHVGVEFAIGGSSKFVHKTVSLVSDTSLYTNDIDVPTAYFDKYHNGVSDTYSLFVNGVSDIDRAVHVEIPADVWPLIKEAIEAYNNYDWGIVEEL